VKIGSKIIHNNKEWKVIAGKGDYIKIRLVGSRGAEKIINKWENSNAWGHRSVLLRNGREITRNKVRYYNRTWEKYEYQTCMYGAVEKLLDASKKDYIKAFKEESGVSRLTSAKKDEVLKDWSKNELVKDLLEIYERIKERKFD
jgi:hypothetical protein